MLYKNDVFELDGIRMRLLEADIPGDAAWCISLDSPVSWPVCLSYRQVADLSSVTVDEVSHKEHSESCLCKLDAAWTRLEPFLNQHGANLYEPKIRSLLVAEYAQAQSCSPVTLRKDLRRFWQRGQDKFALMPDYGNSGRRKNVTDEEDPNLTGGRGRKPSSGQPVFQLKPTDIRCMQQVVEDVYLKDARVTAVDAYTEMVDRHYRYEDGNQQLYARPSGDRPSLRQFQHFLRTHYNIEIRLRKRKGNSDFEREDRKVLGTVLADCMGVGHYYEIDSTIADIYLVSREDSKKIIGKATLYLIIDRKSRLIVGFYFGLENASWNAALQAILSISEDKRALCERYGVEYRPSDWPAHQVFPQEFLADRGDMISHASDNIAQGLQVTVTNLPSKRPDWKPLVECGFRLLHNTLRPVTPAYDPPSNATRRRGKHYEKDACLTVKDFGNLVLNAIILHNRREILDYELTPAELLAGVRPSPIELWNHGIASRAGLLTRFPEERVRFALLRKDTATVTERGVEFLGCFYSFPEAIAKKWFETARKCRFKAVVSYDPRLVDQIYVHALDGKGAPHLATLTDRSQKYTGLSFGEVRYYELLRQQVRQESEHERLQNSLDFRQKIKPAVKSAKDRLKAAGKTSRSARRADTRPARDEERTLERQEQARIQKVATAVVAPEQAQAPPVSTNTHSNQQELFAAIKARMRA
ncbi:Mu transposase C-terminal domain-containing protein [Malikia spinosa]|uniref:DDE-type integrase/transposase/recombinase n=1 Tax=Malikia spinosa TaxID=86180 RepID=A0A7C9IVW0_9BURK|nr:DDE-type integrase/transposase/recombinase [Malikia spinosa]